MKKSKIVLGMMVVGLLFIFIMSSAKPTHAATYSNTIRVDSIQEPEYENILDMEGYQIWYAYNDTFHFLFMITPFNFTIETVTIRNQNDEFYYSFNPSFPISNSFLKTEFANNTLEMRIRREFIGNNFVIEIKTYTFVLSVNPEPKSTTPELIYETEDSDDDEDEKLPANYISPWGIWTVTWLYLTRNPVLYALYPFITTYLILMFLRTCFRPYVFYKNKKGKSKYAGRFAYEKPSEDFPGMWEIYFKRFKEMHKVYSKMAYTEQKRFCYMDAGIVKYFSDILYRKVELTEDMGILYEQELVDTRENKIKYWIYRIGSAVIYGTLVSQWLKAYVEYKVKTEKMDGGLKKIKKTKDPETGEKIEKPIYYQIEKLDENGKPIPVRIKKIHLLQHQLSFDKVQITCDIVYDILESGKAGEIPIHKSEKNKPLFYANDLERNEKVVQDSIKKTNYKTEIIKEIDVEKAIMEQDHIDNIRSISDLKVSKIAREYIDLDKKYNITREQLDDVHRHIKSIITDKIKEIRQKMIIDEDTYVELVSIALTGYKESGDVKEAAKNAFIEYYTKKEAKHIGDYKSKFEIEQAKAKVYEKQVKQLQNKDHFLLSGPTQEELDADLGTD